MHLPAAAGLESCCVSIAVVPPRLDATLGEVWFGVVHEIKSGDCFFATRGQGAHGRRAGGSAIALRPSGNTDLRALFWTAGLRGRPVALLVTIDPVTRGIGPAFLAQVKAGARRWVNVRAGGAAGFDHSDLVAAIGGAYGEAPRDHADQHLVLPHPHAAFAAMLQGRLPEGATLLDLVLAPA